MARKTKAEAEQTRRQILQAARKVFHACGVSRSSLEEIAHVAGVTRGAVYWHFQNKEDLFFAMREEATLPLIDWMDAALGDALSDPLDGIQRTLERLLGQIDADPRLREVLEIRRFRCEYIGESAGIYQALLRSRTYFRSRLEEAYFRAEAKRLLRLDLDPALLAMDTEMFAYGLVERYLAEPRGDDGAAASRLIETHVALRRRVGHAAHSALPLLVE